MAWYDDVLDVATQFYTFGLVGYDGKKGSFDRGFLTQWADEGIGEISGRNMARQALNDQNKRLAQEDANAKQQQLNEQLLAYRQDTLASRTAASVQKTADAKVATSSPTSISNKVDLLGQSLDGDTLGL